MTPRTPAAALAILLFAAGRAHAHGPPPGITAVVTAEGGAATVLAVTEGFAQLRDGNYRFVCPASFGSEQTPPAASADGQRTFVVGDDDLYVLMPDGTVTAQGRPELSRRWVTRLITVGTGVLALRLEGRVTSLVAVEPAGAAPLWTLDGLVDSVTPNGDGFWVGRIQGQTGHALSLEHDGTVKEERTFPVPSGALVARVSESEGVVYVTLVSAQLSGEVLALGADAGSVVRVASPGPVSGPVVFDNGKLLVASDNLLQDMSLGRPIPLADDTTCVGRLLDLDYACGGTELFELAPSGKGARLATLEGLAGPELDRVPEELRATCALEWGVFQTDLKNVGVGTRNEDGDAGNQPEGGPTEPAPAPRASDGCSASRQRPRDVGSAGLVFVALAVSWRRRAGALRAPRFR